MIRSGQAPRRLVALGMAAAALAIPLAGCGKKEPGIPRSDARQLVSLLRTAQKQSDDPQKCADLASTIRDIQSKVSDLPKKTDADIRDSLRSGVQNLAATAQSQCQPTTTIPTTPDTTTIPTTPDTTTIPTTPPPSQTTPPPSQTNPPPSVTTPPPTNPPPQTTPGGTGGVGPGNGKGGGPGNGKKNGHKKKPKAHGAGKHEKGHEHKGHGRREGDD